MTTKPRGASLSLQELNRGRYLSAHELPYIAKVAAQCGKLNDGIPCELPRGTACPDCAPARRSQASGPERGGP